MPYMLLVKYNEFGDWHVYTRTGGEPLWFGYATEAEVEGCYLVQQNMAREFIVVKRVG